MALKFSAARLFLKIVAKDWKSYTSYKELRCSSRISLQSTSIWQGKRPVETDSPKCVKAKTEAALLNTSGRGYH